MKKNDLSLTLLRIINFWSEFSNNFQLYFYFQVFHINIPSCLYPAHGKTSLDWHNLSKELMNCRKWKFIINYLE